jgi:CubicO group peptidase (beta-lactamase class C family)
MPHLRDLLGFGSIFLGLARAAGAQQASLAGFDEFVSRLMREAEVPGVAIAIVRPDSIVFAKGFGVTRLGESHEVDPHTLFAIGSSSKAFTGLGVAMMVDQGKMKWDDRLAAYLAWPGPTSRC